MSKNPDYPESELWRIRAPLEDRYEDAPEMRLASAGVRLQRSRSRPAPCPTDYKEQQERQTT